MYRLNNELLTQKQMDKEPILLGNRNNEVVINSIILITKHEIYKWKWNNKNLLEKTV